MQCPQLRILPVVSPVGVTRLPLLIVLGYLVASFATFLVWPVNWPIYYLSDWLSLVGYVMLCFGIIAAALWPQTAYCMILYLTGLTAVSPELIEAARIEGAKGFTLLRRVILPQLRPATFIAVVVTVIGALRSFDLISVMSDGGPYGSSTVLAFFMYEQAIKYYRQGYGAAIAVVLMLIMLVYIAYFLTRMIRQEREGGR